MQRALPAIAVLLAAPLLGGASNPGSLTITVDGIRNTRGALLACVFKDKAGFPTCQKSKTAIRQSGRAWISRCARYVPAAPALKSSSCS